MSDYSYAIDSASTIDRAQSSSSSLMTSSTAAADVTDPEITAHIFLIVILSGLVVGAFLFFICGLLLKAEAHLQVERDASVGGLLVDDSVHVSM